jgi:hypothetical protein
MAGGITIDICANSAAFGVLDDCAKSPRLAFSRWFLLGTSIPPIVCFSSQYWAQRWND